MNNLPLFLNSKSAFLKTGRLAAISFLLCLIVGSSFVFPPAVKPVSAAAASLYFTPSTGTYAINGKFTVSVKVSSGGDVINAAEGAVSYDSNLLEVTGVSKSGSIFTLWTAEPAAAGGTIRFGGGIPRPGYNGTAGHILSISFRAKSAGKAQVRFSSGAVLANDGKGTNILASMGSGSYTISPTVTPPGGEPSKPKEPSKPAEPEVGKPVVSSPTHPDENGWYKANAPEFKWTLPSGITGVSLDFNQNAAGDPGSVSDGLLSSKNYDAAEDGIWYFHLKYYDGKRWSAVAHYKAQIDTAPPLPFAVTVEAGEAGDWPTLRFEAKDELSGIKEYEVVIDRLDEAGAIVPADAHEYKTSGLKAGEHAAIVKAVDRAGNITIAETVFRVEPIASPVIEDYPAEVKTGDRFYASGSALPGVVINLHIESDGREILSATTSSDQSGRWFALLAEKLDDGRYTAWADAVNDKGIASEAGNTVTFAVVPPGIVRFGSFVTTYFTVITSLLFMIVLIIAMILFLAGWLRRKLKRETLEAEEVVRRNLAELAQTLSADLTGLETVRGAAALSKEKERLAQSIHENIAGTEKKILKEIKDIEEILK